MLVIAWSTGMPVGAQSLTPERSVWMDDYTPATLAAAAASGKTTLIYSGGSSMAVRNHVQVARYVARRVAEELNNALVLPIHPDVEASQGSRQPGARDLPATANEIVRDALRAGGFTDLVIIADEGVGPDDLTLKNLAEQLEADLQPSGVRVFYVTAHEARPGQGMTINADYLRRWASRTVPPERRKAVEDEAELLFADPEHEWFRPDMISEEDRGVVVPALGRILLEQRVSAVLNQIRELSPAHRR